MGGRGFIGETPRKKRSWGIISHFDPLFPTEVRQFCWAFPGRWDIIPAQNWPLNSGWSTRYHGNRIKPWVKMTPRLDFAVLSVDWILVIVAWVLAGTEFNSDLFRASRLGSGGLKPPVVFLFSWFGWKSLPKGFAEALTSNWDVEKSKGFGQLFFQCSKKSIEILHTDWLYLSSGGTHPAFNNDSSILIHPFCQLSSIFMIQWSTESPLYNPLVGDELE